MSTWLPRDTKDALRVAPFFEPNRCESRSLLLLKMLLSADSQAESAMARKTSLERALKPIPQGEAIHQSRWLDDLALTGRVRRFSLWTDQRLALGLANGVIENAGLDLHRLWGTPEISGSKLKGVARDMATKWVRDGRLAAADASAIFGPLNPEADKAAGSAGCISFLAAQPAQPGCRLELDVLTVHYPGYYSGKRPDTDDDNPIPAPFPVVAEGQEFTFHLLCRGPWRPEEEVTRLLDSAEACLRYALIQHGVGSKTRAGYGRFRDTPERLPAPEPADDLFTTPSPVVEIVPRQGERETPPQPPVPPGPPPGTDLGSFVAEWSRGALVPDAIKRFAEAIRKLPPEQRLPAFDDCVPSARRTDEDALWRAFKSRRHGIRLLEELRLS